MSFFFSGIFIFFSRVFINVQLIILLTIYVLNFLFLLL